MEKFYNDCVALIRAALTDKPASICAEFDWEQATELARKHNIAAVLFYGATKSGISQESPALQKLYQMTMHSTIASMQQMYEIERLQQTFEDAGIDYMPMKGTILKPMYPTPEMRTMGDADILIRMEQYPQIQALMEQLEYVFRGETDHELVWMHPSLFLELHKRIMTTYNKDFYRYFGTGWDIARPVPNTHRFEMSPEDFYLYIFVHFTKHYRISGIGINHLLDLWVYANGVSLDWAYIQVELEKLHLGKFHSHVRDTLQAWFADGEETVETQLITNVIFQSGQYGTKEMTMVNRALQNGTDSAAKIKRQQWKQTIFLPLDQMQAKYAVLKKAPVLLPVMWCVRCVDVLLHHQARYKRFLGQIHRIDDKHISENARALHAVGLEFDQSE